MSDEIHMINTALPDGSRLIVYRNKAGVSVMVDRPGVGCKPVTERFVQENLFRINCALRVSSSILARHGKEVSLYEF